MRNSTQACGSHGGEIRGASVTVHLVAKANAKADSADSDDSIVLWFYFSKYLLFTTADYCYSSLLTYTQVRMSSGRLGMGGVRFFLGYAPLWNFSNKGGTIMRTLARRSLVI